MSNDPTQGRLSFSARVSAGLTQEAGAAVVKSARRNLARLGARKAQDAGRLVRFLQTQEGLEQPYPTIAYPCQRRM